MFSRFGLTRRSKQTRRGDGKNLVNSPDAFVERSVVKFVGDLRSLIQFRRASRVSLLIVSGQLQQLPDKCIGRDIPALFGDRPPPGSLDMTCADSQGDDSTDFLIRGVEDALGGLTEIALDFCTDSVPIYMRCNFWATWFPDKHDLTMGENLKGKFLVGELLVFVQGRLIAIPFCAPDNDFEYIGAVQEIFPELGHLLPDPRENDTIYAIFPGLDALSPEGFKAFFDTDESHRFLVNYNLMEVAVFQHHHYSTYVYPRFLEKRVDVPKPYEIDWRGAVDSYREIF
jgi:hypothetical protein